ncbi:A disintegrin and metalloproteinase with thrombospondin motifs 6-like [Amphiura filiformis]|uniref:A disintegrin and metalloproteinase with thrombospondin motifs 6-like n=1 Tax=Amphiura filiformis TaxID=82378 RepID=UPI003B21B988
MCELQIKAITALLLVIVTTVWCQQNQTRVPDTSGANVTQAVVDAVVQSGIFPADNNFLRRIAYVESRDGTDPNTYRAGYDGGIWQVDLTEFQDTQNTAAHPALVAKFNQIQQAFGINWQRVQWSDLRKPLYSAIAARLFLSNKPQLVDFMSSEDIKRYFDVSSIDKVPEYEIVSPYIEEENGRKRRDIEIENDLKEIKLQAFGEHFHMRLKENRYLLADGLEVEQLHANGTIDKIPFGRKRCFYIGQLISHNVSRVAVSTCNGMMGIIAMEEENLFIRPLRDDHAAEYRRRRRDAENPHIIYKRSIEGKPKAEIETNATHFCALDADYYKNATYFHDAVKLSKHKEAYLDENKSVHTIKKRAVGCSVKFMEIRLLIDRDMLDYHGQNAIDYTITLMNIAAARFAEPSLGALVHLHIAKLETIMTDSYTVNGNNLQVSAAGKTTLESLGAFQRNSYIHDDSDPNQWDVAVMVTRKNLLNDEQSDVLQGIAFQDGTCNVVFGAALAEDSGLSSGNIIAHELGHTLGLDHDGSDPNTNCPDNVNVMSAVSTSGAGAFKWSTCSQQQFIQYLSDPDRSSCLNDVPVSVSTHPINSGALPGYQVVTADEQCILRNYTGMCNSISNDETICERLLCARLDNRCFYDTPAAEGTPCGQGKWCISGACVSSAGQFPAAVNGGWSSWASYSQCSRTCGGGVRTRERCCDNPKPENGGTPCSGAYSEIELCNTQTCTTSQPDFAHQQCEATNNEPWQGDFYTWEAYFQDQTEQELCGFICSNNINLVPRGSSFQDGTRCSADFRNELLKCVQGKCVEFGCDNKLESVLRFDNCRVCGGTGLSCSPVTGSYNDGTPFQLTSFLDIPAGSTSVEISNTTPLTSFMALKTASGQYLFGDGTQPGMSGEYYTNGIFVKYYRLDSEDIIIDGPTPVAFTAEVYRVQRPTISYTYYTSNGVAPPPTQAPVPTYFWQTSEGPCSVSCGSGTKQVSAQCFSSSTGTVVSDTFCNPITRPATTQQFCSLPVCPTGPSNYWMLSFGTCSVTCGNGILLRSANCYSPSQGRTVAESECDRNAKPDTSPQQCFEQVCNYWIESEGPCSATCGLGINVNSWRCFSPSSGGIVADNMCDAASRPADTQQSCLVTQCVAIWVTYPFGGCDATCGTAFQTRTVICAIQSGQSETRVQDSECAGQAKPETTILCNRDLPSCGVWNVGPWSQCSVTCDNGFQFRTVVCRPEGYEAFPNPPALSDSECRENKPFTQQSCDSGVICRTIGCNSSPCQNGGTCTSSGAGGYSCACSPGFTGVNCLTSSTSCNSSPCQNGGTCFPFTSGSGYFCVCPLGVTGANCQTTVVIPTNPCLSSPCVSGSCFQGVTGTYFCLCDSGYSGVNCNIPATGCNLSPCQNGGTCTLSAGGYSCTCSPGFTGVNCQIFLTGCTSSPCQNGGTCTLSEAEGYSCTCSPGFTGVNCQTFLTGCNSSPCQNGGTCIPSGSGYFCTCPLGVTGANCQITSGMLTLLNITQYAHT